MSQGNQNFLDCILDKRATYGETVILSAIIGFCVYYFLGDINSIESDGKYAVILTGFPILAIIKKTYWTLRMKKFLLKNTFALQYEQDAFLRYYRNHAWRDVNYYYGYMKDEIENKIKGPGWRCHRCGEYNSSEFTRCNKCTQRKNKPVEF